MAEPTADSTAAEQAPPLTIRRPRVREVSSRFMSPSIQSNSTPCPSGLPRSKSTHHRHPTAAADENQIPEVNRSFEKFPSSIAPTAGRKPHQQQRTKQQQPPPKENGDPKSDIRVLSRPGTPIAMGTDRVIPSRYKQLSNTPCRSNSLSSSSNGCAAVTAAARLLQEATSDVQKKLPKISTLSRDDMYTSSSTSNCTTTTSNQGSSSCPNSPLCVPSTNKVRNVPDTRSSMPDAGKWLGDRISSGKMGGDCARSLNFSSSMKVGGGISLPPHPSSCIRSGLDLRKGKKGSNCQEDVHCLKMLSNHYLQWRFANAKAESSVLAQKQEVERKLYSLNGKISDIRENVKRKHSELAVLRRIKTLSTIVEAQMPYLDGWADMEEDYSASLIGTTNALVNSSTRLPISGEVRVDVGELGEALHSAFKVVELIGSHIQGFIPKAEEMDTSVSELARMARGEIALVEECGDLLSKTSISQVKECSLRSTAIQNNRSIQYQNNHESRDTEP
ncbi:hypothetical protein ABFS82_08G158200 [Erythranthe guttata]|uniref:Uncharacterized protein n=1 Tax=Erythranthe guttata TaxID=4155 RepID=A0A022R1F9_ERYGU|nr:PREDICTED: protein ENDOSPERM DEFECTIVE 1-like [Erythranthe guttata]EYU33814.1 hypothetical protein MIMGU_mgv1a004982mg [Erythranthe guttata]|eukprot:XP_012841909.1 PREDICTED: protein ENDOSPERM DEFECTIVE 1-like [Erythranthe guttata]